VGPPFVTTATAVDRETAWLTSVGDGLPALLVGDGGRWEVVQAYQPRTPATRATQLYVKRRSLRVERFGMIRRMPSYEFVLALFWPLSSGSGSAESDQRAFDLALDDVLARIGGIGPPVADKSHGGRFLSVAENPPRIDVRFNDPANATSAVFEAEITYAADDYDFNG
jgi:hypothetical protein